MLNHLDCFGLLLLLSLTYSLISGVNVRYSFGALWDVGYMTAR